MVQHLSFETHQQSLVFFPHQAAGNIRLFDRAGDTHRNRHIAAGETIGRLIRRVSAAIAGHVARTRVRHELMALDDRLLDDIGLTRGDIEAVAAGHFDACRAAAVTEEMPPAQGDLFAVLEKRAA